MATTPTPETPETPTPDYRAAILAAVADAQRAADDAWQAYRDAYAAYDRIVGDRSRADTTAMGLREASDHAWRGVLAARETLARAVIARDAVVAVVPR